MMTNYPTLFQLLEYDSYTYNFESVAIKHKYIKTQIETLPLTISEFSADNFANLLLIRSIDNDPAKPKVGLVLHSDTVHKPEDNLPVRIEGNKMYGPGACDMQPSIYVVIEILKQLAQEQLLKNIVVIINPTEEKGSPVYQDKFREIAQELDYVMVFEKTEAGKFQPESKEFYQDFNLAVSRKGIFQQTIEVTGPGGHSGMLATKAERKNAISHAIKMMQAIDDLADYEKETTINLAFVNGGKENTVIAENCRFTFDVRFKYETERTRVKSAIERILTTEYIPGTKVEDLGYNYDLPSWQPNSNTEEFFKLVQDVGVQLGYTVNGQARGGWSDGCNLYYYNNKIKLLDGFGPKGEGEHSNQEFVYLDSIEPTIKFNFEILKKLLNA